MKKKTGTFGSKLYRMFLVSILIPFFIALLSFVLYSVRVIMEREERNAQNILNSVSQSMELQFAENKEIRSMFYIYDEVFQEAERLNNPRLSDSYDEYSNTQIENAYTRIMTKTIYLSQQNIRAVTFFPVLGENDQAYFLGKSRARLDAVACPGYKETSWYREAICGAGRAVYHEPHMPEYMPNKKLGEVYSYISAVWDNDTHKAVGVVKLDVDADAIIDRLNMLEDAKDSGLVILKDGGVFARSDGLEGNVKISGNGHISIGSRKYRVKTMKIPETDLEIAYLNFPDSLWRGYLYIMLLSAVFVLLGLGIAFANYRHQAREMVEDIEKITIAARQVEKGNLDITIKIRRDSEFKEVAEVINHMVRELNDYINKEYVLTIQQQKAQYRALQAQINPHFLYNTLNGFVALNRMGEKKLLEKSINRLARLFRYACSNMENASISDELQFVEEYLNLEKLKYDGRLEYMIWKDEACSGKIIPKLLLQPVVENSILHGMGDTDRPVLIQIAACCMEVQGTGSVTAILIRDNGVGFEQGRDRNSGESVGLANVQMRTELYCRDALYQCISKRGEGTKTMFLFPDAKER